MYVQVNLFLPVFFLPALTNFTSYSEAIFILFQESGIPYCIPLL